MKILLIITLMFSLITLAAEEPTPFPKDRVAAEGDANAKACDESRSGKVEGRSVVPGGASPEACVAFKAKGRTTVSLRGNNTNADSTSISKGKAGAASTSTKVGQ